MGERFRGFKPDELERLADLMDELNTAADNAFTTAGWLQVTRFLTPLRELPGWASDTARELRNRATISRLETGDPFAGLAWAGFSPTEIVAGRSMIEDPLSLVFVNAVADWATKAKQAGYARKPGESLNDYLTRLEAAAATKAIPALKPHEQTVAKILTLAGDVKQIMVTAPLATAQGVSLARVQLNNKLWQPLVAKFKIRLPFTKQHIALETRSVTAPGTNLGNLTRGLLMRNAYYRDYLSRLPHYAETDLINTVVRLGRSQAGVRVNGLIDAALGNDKLAELLGGVTHSGQDVKAAEQANLLKVWKATADPAKLKAAAEALKVTPAELSRIGTVARAAGGLRVLGVAGSAISTVVSGVNVVSQGNPVDAFKRKGAGYVADVAEVGFNASLTAAMVCPNPFTLGAVAVTGAVYVGAKVVEHWDDIKKGAGKAVEAVGSGLKKAGNFLKSVNPFG